jgi:hypothetical protein
MEDDIWTSTHIDPTKQIRLLVLEPDSNIHATPQCHLVTTSIDQPKWYHAVSHAWGAPTSPAYIIIGDLEWPVSSPIYDALRHLRGDKDKQHFWTDALPINQRDADERAAQVK